MAVALPTARVSRCVPPAPGRIPSPVSGWPNLAVSGRNDQVAGHCELAAARQDRTRDGRDERRQTRIASQRSTRRW